MRLKNQQVKNFLREFVELQDKHGIVVEADENCPIVFVHDDSEEGFEIQWEDDNRDHLIAKRQPEIVSSKKTPDD